MLYYMYVCVCVYIYIYRPTQLQRILVALNKYPVQGFERWTSVGGMKIQVSLPRGCHSLSTGGYLIPKI
jgi:hypothetical protein